MIVPEQVKLPLLNTAAAHGADDTVLPQVMCGVGGSAAVAAEWMARVQVRAAAREATTMRMRTPGSFRGRSMRRRQRGVRRSAEVHRTWSADRMRRSICMPRTQLTPITV